MSMERKSQYSHHHALVGFGGMLGDGERMVVVIMAIHVSDL